MNSPDVRIAGLVLDWRGAAIPDAEVQTQVDDQSRSAVSDENGYFELPPLPAGEATVFVDWNDEKTTRAVLTLEPGDAFLLIEPGSWNPVSQKTNLVEGVVRDGPNVIREASVSMENISSGERLETRSNNYGRFELKSVPAGWYQVTVHRDGARLTHGRLMVGWMASEHLLIEPGKEISQDTGIFNGRVSDEHDNGIPGASVTITPVFGGEISSTAVEESGYFDLAEGIALGMYHLAVVRDGETLVEERMLLHPHMYLEISTVHGVQEGGDEAAIAP